MRSKLLLVSVTLSLLFAIASQTASAIPLRNINNDPVDEVSIGVRGVHLLWQRCSLSPALLITMTILPFYLELSGYPAVCTVLRF